MRTITLTEEQYNALIQGESVTIEPPKPNTEKWKPKGGDWFVNALGVIERSRTEQVTREFGVEYRTKEQAEKARDAMRTHNRLLAWLAENDDGWVADWSDRGQLKWFIHLDRITNKYGSKTNAYAEYLGVVYMSKNNAEKLCKLLNDGIVEL